MKISNSKRVKIDLVGNNFIEAGYCRTNKEIPTRLEKIISFAEDAEGKVLQAKFQVYKLQEELR